jgi:hypothetical protein
MWSISLFHLTITDTMQWSAPSELSKIFSRRPRIIRPRISITYMGSSIVSSRNYTEITVHIQTAATIICSSALSRHYILQHNRFCATRMQTHCTLKTVTKKNLGISWTTWLTLGPAMNHYRCQNVYISSTASKRIIDTLECFPHNLPMSQISSTDLILMAANDMTDSLKHPHHDVQFATIRDDTFR